MTPVIRIGYDMVMSVVPPAEPKINPNHNLHKLSERWIVGGIAAFRQLHVRAQFVFGTIQHELAILEDRASAQLFRDIVDSSRSPCE